MRQQSTGTCAFCGSSFGKAAMTRHLKSCERTKASERARKPSAKKTSCLHLLVEGRYSPGYWMHLEAPSTATLETLDYLLRNTWLECCGHLSAFEIQGQSYISYEPEDPWEVGGRSMRVALGKVLEPGMKFHYEYDFGSTTELALRVVSEGVAERTGKSIRILARNDAPKISCDSCGEAATQVCTACCYREDGWLCGKCAKRHKCGEEMFLPVVNSPRVGVCGYTG